MEQTNIKLSNNYSLSIVASTEVENPEEEQGFDGINDCFLLHDHRQFDVKSHGLNAKQVYCHLTDVDRYNFEIAKYEIYPVSAYIHSGVVLSLNAQSGFDYSNVGFYLVSKALLKEYYSKPDSLTSVEEGRKLAEMAIENWNLYLSGEIYDAVVYETVYDPISEVTETEEVERLCNYYGYATMYSYMLNDLQEYCDTKMKYLTDERKLEVLKELGK